MGNTDVTHGQVSVGRLRALIPIALATIETHQIECKRKGEADAAFRIADWYAQMLAENALSYWQGVRRHGWIFRHKHNYGVPPTLTRNTPGYSSIRVCCRYISCEWRDKPDSIEAKLTLTRLQELVTVTDVGFVTLTTHDAHALVFWLKQAGVFPSSKIPSLFDAALRD